MTQDKFGRRNFDLLIEVLNEIDDIKEHLGIKKRLDKELLNRRAKR